VNRDRGASHGSQQADRRGRQRRIGQGHGSARYDVMPGGSDVGAGAGHDLDVDHRSLLGCLLDGHHGIGPVGERRAGHDPNGGAGLD
jgi:hypothetical protein